MLGDAGARYGSSLRRGVNRNTEGGSIAFRGHHRLSVQFIWKAFFIALGLRIGFVLLYAQYPFGTGDDRMCDKIGCATRAPA